MSDKRKNPFDFISNERDYQNSLVKERVTKSMTMINPQIKINLDDYDWDNLSEEKQHDVITAVSRQAAPELPAELTKLHVAIHYYGDTGSNPLEKPEWLDMEKFRRGQKIGRDNLHGILFSQLLSLFSLLSFNHSLRPLIYTGKSSTPYDSFKRYLGTAVKCRNWYTQDPWDPSTVAYKDIISTRKMHCNIRSRMYALSIEEKERKSKELIKDPKCPTKDIINSDMQSAGPDREKECPYTKLDRPDNNLNGLSQAEMSSALFGFAGIFIIFPKAFGVHYLSEEDLDDFCHTWRGLSYLLGIDDRFCLCSGSLEETQKKMLAFMNVWTKQNMRQFSAEYEHMLRCMAEGVAYYMPLISFESTLVYFSSLMDVKLPKLMKTFSFSDSLRLFFFRFLFVFLMRIPGVPQLASKIMEWRVTVAANYDSVYLEKLKEKSNESMTKLTKIIQG